MSRKINLKSTGAQSGGGDQVNVAEIEQQAQEWADEMAEDLGLRTEDDAPTGNSGWSTE